MFDARSDNGRGRVSVRWLTVEHLISERKHHPPTLELMHQRRLTRVAGGGCSPNLWPGKQRSDQSEQHLNIEEGWR